MSDSPSILIVDDFPDGREMVAEYLSFRGFEVIEASDGRQALNLARRLHPTVILMDLTMPVLDGWKATRRLKADPATKGIPVIVVSAHAMDGAEASAREAGCDGFIAKPHDLSLLCDLLWRIVREGPAAAQAKTTSATSVSSRVAPRKMC